MEAISPKGTVRWTGLGDTVAGLADTGGLFGVLDRYLNRPPGGVAFDQIGGAGGQVGADQGDVVAGGAGAVAHEDDLHLLGAEDAVPRGVDHAVVTVAVSP